MPNYARSHAESRKVVCLICMNKAKEMRNITSNMRIIIQRHCIEGYDVEDERLPTSLCGSCRTILQQHDKGNFTRQIHVYDYSEIGKQPRIRPESEGKCYCKVCQIARSNILGWEFGLPKRRVGRPLIEVQSALAKSSSVLKLCPSCLDVMGLSKLHDCPKVLLYVLNVGTDIKKE